MRETIRIYKTEIIINIIIIIGLFFVTIGYLYFTPENELTRLKKEYLRLNIEYLNKELLK